MNVILMYKQFYIFKYIPIYYSNNNNEKLSYKSTDANSKIFGIPLILILYEKVMIPLAKNILFKGF